MTELEIYVDVAASGRLMAHLLEPPGFGPRFESRVDMDHRLPGALKQHLEWLRSHGEPSPDPTTLTFRIAAEVAVVGNLESGDDVGFYAPDIIPVSPEEVERYLRIAGYAHEDLLRLVAGLSDDTLGWVRDERTRPIRRIIRHVVRAELWYMTRIIDDPAATEMPPVLTDAYQQIDATEDIVEWLRIVWPAFQAWARSLTPELRSRTTMPTWFTERKDERWTARKMLRRCIEHCREHTRNIEQILVAYRAAAARQEHARGM